MVHYPSHKHSGLHPSEPTDIRQYQRLDLLYTDANSSLGLLPPTNRHWNTLQGLTATGSYRHQPLSIQWDFTVELTANLWTYRHRPLYANGTLYGGLIATIGLITPDLFALEEHFIEELLPDGLIATHHRRMDLLWTYRHFGNRCVHTARTGQDDFRQMMGMQPFVIITKSQLFVNKANLYHPIE